ncbi:cytochrome P450 [Citricoccus sp. NPDC055426]|uniref:cytochrome P450 n=1 Tax=Citricoccus sp. NPDC055426 TaxID=3155536 RepID=UPI003443665E
MTAPAHGVPAQAPTLDLDPFSIPSLQDPFPIEDAIREAGPVVWLESHGIWATGRADLVQQVFLDQETFISSHGTGLTNTALEDNWRKPSVILEQDQPQHTVTRKLMNSALSLKVVKQLKDDFQAAAHAIVAEVCGRGEFDAVTDLAEAYPLQVLPDAIGLAPEGREHLLTYANLNFQAMGPRDTALYEEAVNQAAEAKEYVEWQMRRENLDESRLAGKFFAAADTGTITEETAGLLVRTFLSAGLDTTMLGIGNALLALSRNPGAWSALREDPSLARTAFEETLRCYAPSPYIGRTVGTRTELGGVVLEPEQKIVNCVSAANRDPRRWQDPESFDITRDVRGHAAFGYGIHACVGQMMARMEAESLLTAVATQVQSLEVTAEPVRKINHWLRGYSSLPMRVTLK